MTAKPRDDMAAAAAGRGRLRASHADREHVLDVLKAAFVQGRLTEDEFDMRVGQTFASRTYAELAALTADIPAGLIGVQPLRKPARAEAPHPQNKVVNSCGWPRVFRTAEFALFHAASCRFRYSLRTSCGVLYPSVEWRRARLYRSSMYRAISSLAFFLVG